MASEIRVNQIQNRSGLTTTTFTDTGVIVSGIVTANSFSGSGASLTNIPSAQLTGALPALDGSNLTGITQTTINNNAGNKVITGSNTTNTLEAQDTLRYDGTNFLIGTNTEAPYNNRNLTVAAGASGNTTVAIEIRSPSNGTGRVIFSDGTSADSAANEGQVIYQQSDHKMLFGVAANYQNMALESTGGTGANLNLIDGNLKLASGHGIDFSATSDSGGMTGELLSDYEEGTWTPEIKGTTGAGTASYNNQVGKYLKIGNWVYLTWVLGWSSGSAGGEMRTTGFPFTPAADCTGIGSVMFNNVSIHSSVSNIATYIGPSNAYCYFYTSRSSAGWITVNYSSSGNLIANVSFRTA